MVWFRAEARETFFIKVNSQGVDRGDEHVYSTIKLELVDEQRLLNILLHNVVIVRRHVFMAVHEEDAASLTRCLWLYYKHRPLTHGFIQELVLEFTILGWQQVSARKKLVVLWEFLCHFNKVSSKMIFARQLEHASEVVRLLVWLQLGHFLWWYAIISPINVPVFLILRECLWFMRIELGIFLWVI